MMRQRRSTKIAALTHSLMCTVKRRTPGILCMSQPSHVRRQTVHCDWKLISVNMMRDMGFHLHRMEHVPTTFQVTQACTLGEGTSITMHVPTSILVELMEPWSVMNFLWLESPLLINRRCTSITLRLPAEMILHVSSSPIMAELGRC